MAVVSKATPARRAAVEVLREVREREAYVQDVLAQRVDVNTQLRSEDRAFATRLTIGVVQTYGTLDELINLTLKSPRDIKPNVRDALRVSTYEIIFLKKQAHAAVSQGVELVRYVAPKAANLANRVLRQVADQARTFPFGDPDNSLEAAARLHAFPYWLAQKLEAELGPRGARAFMQASNDPAPLYLAVNYCHYDDQKFKAVLGECGEVYKAISVANAKMSGCYQMLDHRALLVPKIKELLDRGNVIVADAASQLVAASVLPGVLPGSVLEVGAGRGTKTVLLQSNALKRWNSQMSPYTTLDVHGFKTSILKERIKKSHVSVDHVLSGDACQADSVLHDACFDFVFVDAPCSGLGTLRRHPEIRWRLKPSDFQHYQQTQVAMLRSLASHVNPGGSLAYATCTVCPEENVSVVKAFLSSEEGSDFTLAPIVGKSHLATTLTPGSSDAHFAVRFERKA